jgi:ABC-type amino acid transport substrate-binding protein
LIDKPEGKDFKLDGGEVWGGDPNIPEDQRGYVFAVRKDDKALLGRINKALTSMMDDCTYTKLRRVYIKFPILRQDEACEAKLK